MSNNTTQNTTTQTLGQTLKQTITPKKCKRGFGRKLINYFAVALSATIVFVIFHVPIVDQWFQRHIPNRRYRLLCQALILFTIVYIVNRVTLRWKSHNRICGEPYDVRTKLDAHR